MKPVGIFPWEHNILVYERVSPEAFRHAVNFWKIDGAEVGLSNSMEARQLGNPAYHVAYLERRFWFIYDAAARRISMRLLFGDIDGVWKQVHDNLKFAIRQFPLRPRDGGAAGDRESDDAAQYQEAWEQ